MNQPTSSSLFWLIINNLLQGKRDIATDGVCLRITMRITTSEEDTQEFN